MDVNGNIAYDTGFILEPGAADYTCPPPAITRATLTISIFLACLPRTWPDALTRFDQGPILKEYFGPDYCQVYSRCKWANPSKMKSSTGFAKIPGLILRMMNLWAPKGQIFSRFF